MLQTKRFLAIVASMVNRMRVGTTKVTDYSVGSVARTMLEATAQEIDELYQQVVAAVVDAVPVATYRSFSFDKLPAVAAGGLVRVQITPANAAVIIPANTLFTQGLSAATYTNAVDAVIPAGASFVDVPVVATVAGSAGNLAAGAPFTLSRPPTTFLSAYNLGAWIGGRDLETADQQKTRFGDFIATLPRGTVDALQYAALDKAFLTDASGNITERVAFAVIVEPYTSDPLQPVGWVQVFVHNGTGGTSPALVARTAQILYGYFDGTGQRVAGYKAAGVRTDVLAATEQLVSFQATVSGPLGAASVSADAAAAVAPLLPLVQQVVTAYLLGLAPGQSCITAKIVDLAMDVPGVTNFVITSGLADMGISRSGKFMPGAIGLT